jgi:hypothetical protein
MGEVKYSSVSELAQALSLDTINAADPDRAVTGGYCGDLLSWVMGRAPADSAWITVMSNVNVIAVASLADVACVIMAEGATPDPDALEAAQKRGINVLGSKLSAFELARKL